MAKVSTVWRNKPHSPIRNGSSGTDKGSYSLPRQGLHRPFLQALKPPFELLQPQSAVDLYRVLLLSHTLPASIACSCSA